MTKPRDPSETESSFLSVKDAEIVHGPDVIAEKVSGALRDADRFDLPQVKPPLADALGRVVAPAGPDEAPADGPAEQDALAGKAAAVDENAGSAKLLEPGADAKAS